MAKGKYLLRMVFGWVPLVLCSQHPRRSPDLSCVADPPHGFTPECVPDDDCTITPRRLGFATERWWSVDCLFVLGLLPAWRKRFRRARGLPFLRVPDQDQPNRAR